MESPKASDGFFDSFRMYGLNTYYPPNKTAVTADVLEAGLIFAVCIVALSFLVIVPGIRGKERLFSSIRIFLSIFVFAIILLGNFGQEWEVAEISTRTAYKAFTGEEIHASISVKIGLRSVNITLKGEPENQIGETINYNERFHWGDQWNQGRVGFGPFAGQISQEFRAAQWKGLPFPILWIAEYFTLDGEEIRWGRSYRTSGFYTHIFMWLAFPLWILTNIMLGMVLRYGAYFMALTGCTMLLANLLYASLRWGPALTIPFEDATLTFTYGWCFWLTLITGLMCVIMAVIIIIMDYRFPTLISTFLNSDILQDYEDTVDEKFSIGEKPVEQPKRVSRLPSAGEEVMEGANDMDKQEENGGLLQPPPDDDSVYMNVEVQPVYRTRAASRFKVSRRRPRAAPRPPQQDAITEGDEGGDETYDYPPAPRKMIHQEPSVKFSKDGRTQYADKELASYGASEGVVSVSLNEIPLEELQEE